MALSSRDQPGSRTQNVKFNERTELARYIDEDQRLSGNRPASSAFLANPGDTHLSVNSRDIENLDQIASYFYAILQENKNNRAIAVALHRIATYNDEIRKVGVSLVYRTQDEMWFFADADASQPAYRHRPVPSM